MSKLGKFHPILILVASLLLAAFISACAATDEVSIPTASAPTATPTSLPSPEPTAVPTLIPPATQVPGPTPAPTAVPVGIQNANAMRLAGETGAGTIGRLAVSPDGKWIAAAGSRGFRLFDKFTFEMAAQVTAHAGEVLQLAWDPSGSRIASAGADGTVRIWDVTDPHAPHQTAILVGHTGAVRSLAWSPDGAHIASGGEDQTIRVWNAQTFKNTFSASHTSAIYSLDWHPDSELLLIGEFDGSISVTNGLTGENFASFQAHDGWVNAARWSPNGTAAVTGGLDRVLRVWDLEAGFDLEERAALGTAFAINAIAWTPDGARIAAAGGTPFTIAFYDSTPQAEGDRARTPAALFEGHTAAIDGLAFAPGGVLLTSSQDNTLRAWNLGTGIEIRRLSPAPSAAFSSAFNSVDWSPDGVLVATGGSDGTLRTWDPASGENQLLVSAHTGQITSLDWSPGGNWIATGGSDNFTRVWDAATGEPVQEVRSEGGQVNAVAFSPFGNLLASGGFFRIVQVWTAGTDQSPLLLFPDVEITALGWASSGSVLAVGGNDGTVHLYNGQTGADIGLLGREHNTSIIAIRWEPLGGRIAAIDRRGTIVVWDSGSGELLARREGDGRVWNSLSWAPQGVLAAANEDGVVLVLEAATLAPLSRIAGHSAAVNALAFTESGNRLVSASGDGSLAVWEAAAGIPEPLVLEAPGAGFPGAPPAQDWPPASILSAENAGSARQLAVIGRGTALVYAAAGDHVAVGGGTGAWIYSDTEGELLRYLEGGRTFGLAWSPDGRMLAARELQLLRIWDVEKALVLRAIPVGLGVRNTLAWSPDGLMLAVADRQGEVSVYSLASGEKISTWETGAEVQALAWHADGRRLAAASGADIRLLDPASGTQTALLRGHKNSVRFLAFHPTEPLLLSGGEDLSLMFWDLSDLAPPPEGESTEWPDVPAETIRVDLQGALTGLAWSPSGDSFFSAHENGVVFEWGASTRQPLKTVSADNPALLSDGRIFDRRTAEDGYFAAVNAVQWLGPDTLVFLDEIGLLQSVRISGPETTEAYVSLDLEAGVQNLIPGSSNLIIRHGAVRQASASGEGVSGMNLPPGLEALSPADWVSAASPDGTVLAVFNPAADPAAVTLLDLNSGDIVLELTLEPDLAVVSLAWSPDGARLAAGLSNGTVRTWNTVTGTGQLRAGVYAQRTNGLAWSPDGRILAVSGSDGSENGGYQVVRLLDVVNGRVVREFALDFARTPVVLAFSPDGRLLASGDSGGDVQLWDAASGVRLADFTGHKLAVSWIAFSPEGRAVATAGRDGTVRVWGVTGD